MITAIIRNKENTLVLELPHSIYDIYEKLQSIGIMQPPKQIPLTDNEDEDIGVKLFSESDFGQHLLLTLHEKNTIADANTMSHGKSLTARISVSPNPESACILSDILEKDVPEKYFLSQTQMQRLLSNSLEAQKAIGSTRTRESALLSQAVPEASEEKPDSTM